MKILPHTVLAAILLTAGILGGRAIHPSTGTPSTTGDAVENPAASRRPGRPPAGNATTAAASASGGHTLSALLAFQSAGGRAGALHQGLSRMELPALHALILEQQAAPAEESAEDTTARRNLLKAALRELWTRSGTDALAWAAALPDRDQSGTILRGLLESALPDDPIAALPWMRKYHETFGKGDTSSSFLSLAMSGGAARSADDVISLFGELGQGTFVNPLYSAAYADDFDFAKLHAALDGKTDLSDAISAWAARDPDAAWAAISKPDTGPRDEISMSYVSTPFSALLIGLISRDGEAAGVRWAMDRLASLTPDQRQVMLHGIDPMGNLSAEGAAALSSRLTPSERASYISSIIITSGDSPRTYAVLDGLPRPDLINALRSGRRTGSSSPFSPRLSATRLEALDNATRARYQLTDAEMAAIRQPKEKPGTTTFNPAETYAPKE